MVDASIAESAVSIDVDVLADVIESTEIREPFDLWSPLKERANALDDTDPRKSGLLLVADLVFYQETFEERHTPYRAKVVKDGKRSGEPDDLSDEALNALAESLPRLDHPVIRARIADILWLRERKPYHAHIAIDAYLDAARQTESVEHWTACASALDRAHQLALMFRRGASEYLVKVLKQCDELVRRIDGDDPLYLSHRVIEILSKHDYGDVGSQANLAERIAERATENVEFQRARTYWQLVADLARRRQDDAAQQAALQAIVECFVRQGMASGDGLGKVHFLEKAVSACSRVKGSSERREEIHALLREAQRTLPDTLQAVELPEDIQQQRESSIEDARRKTLEALTGRELLYSLLALTFKLFRPIDQQRLRDMTADIDRGSIASTIAGQAIIDARGRTVARRDPSSDIDGAALHNVIRNAMFEREFICNGVILPALELIELEHHVSEQFVYEEIVAPSAFVPDENIAIVAKGIWFGLMRDFIGATSILVPQFEACIRHVLEQRDVRISAMGPDEVEKFLHLPTLLATEETQTTFESDVLDDLRLILVEPSGSNLRAAVAHGFVTDAHCWSPEAIYAWWHMLRLTLLPMLITSADDASQD